MMQHLITAKQQRAIKIYVKQKNIKDMISYALIWGKQDKNKAGNITL